MSVEQAIVVFAAFVFALIILGKLRNIERVNRAMARGRAAEVQYAWHLNDLYAVLKMNRAEGHNFANSEQFRGTVREIWQIQALIADAYDPNEGTRNIDGFEERWLEEIDILNKPNLAASLE
jgi:hypothetical protein